MEEWLLSGYNTQESVAVARPLSLTGVAGKVNDGVDWMRETIYRGIDVPEISVPPALSVQGWLYLNVDYSVRIAVLPFDPTTLGVPVDFLKEHPEYKVEKPRVGLLKVLQILLRGRELYQWAVNFYDEKLPALDAEFRAFHHRLRATEHVPLEEIWSHMDQEHHDLVGTVTNIHNLVNVILISLDSVLQQQAPELTGLLVGQSTTTSQLGQRVWALRNIALECGPAVTDLLKQGVGELDRYEALPEAQPFVDALRAFLKDYGHRGLKYELDAAAPRLAEHPEQILLAVAGQLDQENSPLRRAIDVRSSLESDLQNLPLLKRALWSRLFNWAQHLIARREDSKSFLALVQSSTGMLAQHLKRYFYPKAPDDILLFYTFNEFQDFVLSRGKVSVPLETLKCRRREFKLHFSQTPPPELIWYEPETRHWRPAVESADKGIEEARNQFRGIPASAGSGPVEGVAVVTNDPVEAGRRLLELEGDVILVTRLTDPAWSSLFGGLSGVVTELGGVISHAAIVARENGLPAVVGIPEITKRVRDGQRLCIDGATGIVDVLK